ncbi:hypothetical protein Q3G72_001081 [Acer saccharum]|nr:hypothetical protein Q3G72_001081 [Acer saccharum]
MSDRLTATATRSEANWRITEEGFGSFKLVKMVYDIQDFLRIQGDMVVMFSSRTSNSFVDNFGQIRFELGRELYSPGDV